MQEVCPIVPVKVGPYQIGPDQSLLFIVGPCVIESRELVLKVASRLVEIRDELGVQIVFKSSFDKANRSSIDSFRGPGLEKGLEILSEVKEKTGLPLTTDIHLPEQAEPVAQVVDLLQIPAFLCRQTDLLLAAAETGLPVSVKKGQFMAPWEMKNVVEKLRAGGCDEVILVERGTSFGYNNLIVDMTGLQIMRELGCPVIFDGTHSVQLPGALGKSTGGRRQFVSLLSRSAAAAGVDGLFWEVHPDPDSALSDGSNCLHLDDLPKTLSLVLELDKVAKEHRKQHG